ncbi:RidA family protein [Herbiconiux moechotypicola]|uniref:RidA family protein n=1 Tax=Herbiconiux moechotypicola TaxID=637393 RepID=A0ABN3DEX6_9MICO|nr:RidA family protein [Herbiconiux moechotypicola]MCS5729352.1 RidA family protein [Herbiconiux moechotypicola]
MTRRSSIELAGFSHVNPVPAGSRIGPFLFSGVLTGRDPHSGELPDSLEEQVGHVFGHVAALLAAAGGSVDDIVKMTFWVVRYRDREAINRSWIELFPDASSRPARQVMAAQLDGGSLIQCDLVAVLAVPDSGTGAERGAVTDP